MMLECKNVIGGDWFILRKSKRIKKTLLYYLEMFNPNDYFIYKMSSNQREITIEELHELKYCGYVFFSKKLYNSQHINNWIEFLKPLGGTKFLNKPFPPEYVKDKINIIK